MKFYLIGTLLVPILTFIITFIFRYKRFKNTEIFGNARFSKLDELLNQGLVGEGIVFGKVDNKLIMKAYNYALDHHGDQCRRSRRTIYNSPT